MSLSENGCLSQALLQAQTRPIAEKTMFHILKYQQKLKSMIYAPKFQNDNKFTPIGTIQESAKSAILDNFLQSRF